MRNQVLIYEIGKWSIMEILYDDIFEYYARETDNRCDYYRFQFGSLHRFSEENLTALVENDYFMEVE